VRLGRGRRIALAGLAVVAALATSCSTGAGSVSVHAIAPLPPGVLPPTVAGLTVVDEPLNPALYPTRPSFVDAVAFFSLRLDRLAEATLQLDQLRNLPVVRKSSFEEEVADDVGVTTPVALHLDGVPVWVSSGLDQQLWVWFKPGYLAVLAVRTGYPFPRSVLRAALAATP